MTSFNILGGSWFPCQWKKSFPLSLLGGRIDELFMAHFNRVYTFKAKQLQACWKTTSAGGCALEERRLKKLEQGLFTLFCRFAPRPGKSWDSQTLSHTSSPLAFLPSLCSQSRMSQMARQRGVVEGGRPMKQADLESAQALPLPSWRLWDRNHSSLAHS